MTGIRAAGTTLTVGELREVIAGLPDNAEVRTMGNVLAADVVHGGLLITDDCDLRRPW